MLVKGISAGGLHGGRARLHRPRPRDERDLRRDGRRARAREPLAAARRDVGRLGRPEREYPIVSIEDGLAEDDWDGWKRLTDARQQDAARRRRPLRDEHRAPAARDRGRRRELDPRQGEPDRDGDRDARRDRMARAAGYTAVISHRSGETEDTTIADLAVATDSGQIKTGSPSRTDASRSTTSCCASRRSSAPTRASSGATCCARSHIRLQVQERLPRGRTIPRWHGTPHACAGIGSGAWRSCSSPCCWSACGFARC